MPKAGRRLAGEGRLSGEGSAFSRRQEIGDRGQGTGDKGTGGQDCKGRIANFDLRSAKQPVGLARVKSGSESPEFQIPNLTFQVAPQFPAIFFS